MILNQKIILNQKKEPEFEFIGPSKEILCALNYGKFPDAFPRFIGDETRKQLNYDWKKPANLDSQLPFALKGRTSHEKRFATLYTLLSHGLYPFWCYCIENNGPGLLFIEIENTLRRFGKLDEVMNTDLKIIDKPLPLYAVYLNPVQIRYYLEQKHRKKDEIDKNIEIAKDAYKNGKVKMGIVFSCLNENDQSITMDGPRSYHSDTYQRELKTFTKLLNVNYMNYCNYIQLNMKDMTMYGHYYGHLYHKYCLNHLKYVLPRMESLYALNKDSHYGFGYPNFTKYGCEPTLFNDKVLPFKFEDNKPYKVYDNAQRDKIPKLFKMNKLYQHYLGNILYPYWCYCTKRFGIGSIYIQGFDPETSKLSNLVDKKGNIKSNPIKLIAVFLPFDNLKRFLLFYGDKTEDNKSLELQTAEYGFRNKRDRISIIFSFRDTKMLYCLNGIKSQLNKEYEQELERFESLMKDAKIKKIDWMLIDLKYRYSIGCELKKKKDVERNMDYLDEFITEIKKSRKDKLKNEDEISRVCGYCEKDTNIVNRCSRCKNMWYCNALCQKKHWKVHKKKCKKRTV